MKRQFILTLTGSLTFNDKPFADDFSTIYNNTVIRDFCEGVETCHLLCVYSVVGVESIDIENRPYNGIRSLCKAKRLVGPIVVVVPLVKLKIHRFSFPINEYRSFDKAETCKELLCVTPL